MTRPTLIFGHAGVGGALAKLLRSRGIPVHVVGRNEEALKDLSLMTGCTYSRCDVTADGEVAKAIESALAKFDGRLSGLVFAVGSIPIKSIKQATVHDVMQTFRLNTAAAFEAAKHSQSALSDAEDGAIVFFSTVAARHGFTNHSLISAAKGGIEGLTVALAAEFAPKVRVNCIAPSLTCTPLTEKMISNEKMAKSLGALHPLGRLGKPEDLAEVASFLLSPASSWITGQVLPVDGGRGSVKK